MDFRRALELLKLADYGETWYQNDIATLMGLDRVLRSFCGTVVAVYASVQRRRADGLAQVVIVMRTSRVSMEAFSSFLLKIHKG